MTYIVILFFFVLEDKFALVVTGFSECGNFLRLTNIGSKYFEKSRNQTFNYVQ